MTQHQINSVILKDEAGTFYLLSPELLARARATAEQQAALEQGGADTVGFGGYAQGMFKMAGLAPPAATIERVSAERAGEMESTEEFGSWRDIEAR